MKAITCVFCGRWEAPTHENNIPMEEGYAHAHCLRTSSAAALSAIAQANEGAVETPRRDPIVLVARHCRACEGVGMGRKDVYKGIDPDSHLVPGTDLLCQRPDFGPEVIVATVPW